MFEKISNDLSHSIKLIAGAMSGFDGLQFSNQDGWEYVEEHIEYDRRWDGQYVNIHSSFSLADAPYYICVRWENGRHCPLPIILYLNSEYSIQNLVVRVLHRLAFYADKCEAFRQAFEACAYYEHQFD